MNQIKSIHLKDWKGINKTLEIEDLNILVGPNGSGKSAWMEAIGWAILGRSPHGAKPEAAVPFAGFKGCEVGLAFNDGFYFQRALIRDAKTAALKQRLEIEGHPSVSVRDAQELIHGQCGDFAVMFDLGEFTRLSPEKRRKFLIDSMRRSPSDKASPKDLAYRVAWRYLCHEHGPATMETAAAIDPGEYPNDLDLAIEHVAKLCNTWIAKMAKREAGIVAQMVREMETGALEGDEDPLSILAYWLDRTEATRNGSKAEHIRATEASRKLSEQRAELGFTYRTLEEIDKEIKSSHETMLDTKEQIGRHEGRAKGIEKLQQSVDIYKNAIAEFDVTLKELAAVEFDDWGDMERVAKEHDKHVDKDWVEVCETALTTAKADLATILERLEETRDELRNAEARVRSYGQVIEAVRKSDWAYLLRLADDFSPTLSPEGSPHQWKMWQNIYDTIYKFARTDDVKDARASLDKAKEEVTRMELSWSSVSKEREAMEAKIAELTDEHDRRACADLEHDQAAKALRSKARVAHDHYDNIQAALTRCTNDREHAITQRVAHEKQLNDLMSETEVANLDDLNRLFEATGAEHAKLLQNRNDKVRVKALEEELTKCIASAEHEGVLHECAKTMCQAIKDVRETAMATMAKPFLGMIDAVLFPAIQKRSYCDLVSERGRPIFDLGWIDGDRKRSLVAMSGGEAALFGGALAFALVAMAEIPMKLLLIEASELDWANLGLLMNGINANRGSLSNVMIATHMNVAGSASHDNGWRVWRM